jgi:signal transduction histidine kinase
VGARRIYRSISTPIVLGSIAVALTIFLLVGWIIVVLRYMELARGIASNTWILVAGLVSFAVVLSVVVLFSVFLVREILEVRRQITFIDSVTHELKTPLASLKLCLETMARPDVSEEQRAALKRMMRGDVDRLTTFIDDVLESSRIAHGRRPYALGEVHLADLLHDAVDELARHYQLEPGSVTVHVVGDGRVVTDAAALATVVKNLVDNGIKYSNRPVHVEVSARVEGQRLVLEVQDSGIGIAPKHLKRVFERFYRVPTEAVYSRAGSGLGLFVVWSLVRGLGGRLEAQSEGPDRGTRMRVELPVAAAARG